MPGDLRLAINFLWIAQVVVAQPFPDDTSPTRQLLTYWSHSLLEGTRYMDYGVLAITLCIGRSLCTATHGTPRLGNSKARSTCGCVALKCGCWIVAFYY